VARPALHLIQDAAYSTQPKTQPAAFGPLTIWTACIDSVRQLEPVRTCAAGLALLHGMLGLAVSREGEGDDATDVGSTCAWGTKRCDANRHNFSTHVGLGGSRLAQHHVGWPHTSLTSSMRTGAGRTWWAAACASRRCCVATDWILHCKTPLLHREINSSTHLVGGRLRQAPPLRGPRCSEGSN